MLCWIGLCWIGPLAFAADSTEPSEPRLSVSEVPAAGEGAAVATVPRFGRYSFSVASDQGVQLEVLDRMAGSLGVDGALGEADGRLDLLLDRGEYKLLTQGAQGASGKARLTVAAFAERNETPIQLLEGKLVEADLGDLEQRSYWLDLSEPTSVVLEAAGRHLGDLRLWQDGAWLVDAAPEPSILEPRPGKPLRLLRLAAQLPAGLYQLIAYGGPEQTWSVESAERPFALRWGVPKLPEAGRRRFVMGPFGFERYRVPALASFFRLELPSAETARLTVDDWDPDQPFAVSAEPFEISKKSVPPAVSMTLRSLSNGERVVTVEAQAGQAYVLQHFRAQSTYVVRSDAPHWIASVSSGDPRDAIDLTAVLLDERGQLVGNRTVPVGMADSWQRRFNLLAAASLQVRLLEAGVYQVEVTGTPTRVRFEPLPVPTARNYKAPAAKPAGEPWELDAGYYTLHLEPEQPGIVEVKLARRNLVDRRQGNAPPPRQVGVRFPQVAVPAGQSYRLLLNTLPGVTTGFVVRPLPLDLAEPLPMSQGPAEEVEVPFVARTLGRVVAQGEDGQALELSLDGGPFARFADVAPGEHRVRVRNGGLEPLFYTLALTPRELLAETLPPLVPPDRFDALPRLPVLAAGATQGLDLDRQETRTFQVQADRPGLYRLESTGLLATEGNLRTRTVPSLVRRVGEGTGRNFLVQGYLREGDYQLSVTTLGASKGRLGLRLSSTEIADGGRLIAGVAARRELQPGTGVGYRFEVPAGEDEHVLRILGQERSFRARVEDGEGWPLVVEDASGEISLPRRAGSYRVIVLPEATEGRVLTLLERRPAPVERQGHGPFELALERTEEHVWREPAKAAERSPDRWRFDLGGAGEVTVRLSEEMVAELRREGQGEVLATVHGRRDWTGRLEAGRYELAATARRPNDRLPYRLSVSPRPWVAGLTRWIGVPAEVEVAIGSAGFYELASFGGSDVKAELLAADGTLVASADDRPEDWNFQLVERLEPGTYKLRLGLVRGEEARTELSLRRLEEKAGPVLPAPGKRSLDPGRGVTLLPLEVPASATVLAVEARSLEQLTAALEVSRGGQWQAVATGAGSSLLLAVPVTAEPYRLRLSSLDGRGNPVALATAVGTGGWSEEAALGRGVALTRLSGLTAPLGFAAVRLARAGCFALEGGGELATSFAAGRGFAAVRGVAAGETEQLFLLGSAGERVRGARVVLRPGGEPVRFTLPAGRTAICDVADGDGLALVRASSPSGRPGLAPATAGASPRFDRQLAVAPRAALAVLPAGTARRLAIAAGEDGPMALELATFEAKAAPSGALLVAGRVALGPAANRLDLGGSPQRLRLVLAPESAAVLVAPSGQPASLAWADEEAQAVELPAASGQLVVAALGPAGGRAEAEVGPAAAAPAWPLERRATHAGRWQLELPPAGDLAGLAVWGGAVATVVDGAGRVESGRRVAWPAAGGTLTVDHEPGWVLVAGLDAGGRARLRPGAAGPGERIALPAQVKLSGPSRRLAVEAAEPGLLLLEASGALLVEVERPDRSFEVRLLSEGGRLDLASPGGTLELALSGLGGQPLAGDLNLRWAPVVGIGEGRGEAVLLAPGETRAFRFEVRQKGPVGVGAASASTAVEARLIDLAGRERGRGVVGLAELEPGSYLLALHLPPEAAAAEARPVVVGLERPPSLPPAEIIQCFAEQAAGKRPETENCLAAKPAAPAVGQPLEESSGSDESEPSEEELEEYGEGEGGEGEDETIEEGEVGDAR